MHIQFVDAWTSSKVYFHFRRVFRKMELISAFLSERRGFCKDASFFYFQFFSSRQSVFLSSISISITDPQCHFIRTTLMCKMRFSWTEMVQFGSNYFYYLKFTSFVPEIENICIWPNRELCLNPSQSNLFWIYWPKQQTRPKIAYKIDVVNLFSNIIFVNFLHEFILFQILIYPYMPSIFCEYILYMCCYACTYIQQTQHNILYRHHCVEKSINIKRENLLLPSVYHQYHTHE